MFSNRITSQLTEKQQNILKENRDISIYPTDDQISIIAQQTGLSPYSIKKWFNNTRYTERKEKKKNRDNFDNPASYCAFSGNARSNILTCSSNPPTRERINMDKDIDEVSPLVCPLAPVSCTDKTSMTRDGLRGRRFTEKQLTILRANFDISIYPTGDQISIMAQQTRLPPYSIKKWFYNTRYTEKRRLKIQLTALTILLHIP